MPHPASPPPPAFSGRWITDANEMAPFLTDWRGNRLVHDAVVAHGGSISAEHGLGVLRRDESARYKSFVEMSLMRAIKQALSATIGTSVQLLRRASTRRR